MRRPDPRQVAVPTAALRKAAHPMAEQWDQLLFGELFRVLDVKDGFAWGQAARDGYVGFVAEDDLAAPGEPATHQVAVPRTYAFAEPEHQGATGGPYSLNALTAVEATEGRFAKGEGTGWFVAAHLAPVGVSPDRPGGGRRRLSGRALPVGRPRIAGPGLLGPGAAGPGRLRPGRCPRDTDMQLAFFARSRAEERGAATWCSGRATWPSCWTPTPSCTPTPTTWPWRSSPWPTRIARVEAAGGGAVTGWRRP
jgi:hypothetical protein